MISTGLNPVKPRGPERVSTGTLMWVTVVLTTQFFAPLPAWGQDGGDAKIGLRINEDRLRSNRIRKITSPHLTLYTDLPSSADVDELGDVFTQAVRDWKIYFQDKNKENFRATGFLMVDRDRFLRAGVIPEGLPEFKNGYTYGTRTFWIYDQPSSYMRRQLLIHEGTHAFLFSRFGSSLPAWFNEGLAEMFASHQWNAGKLQTRVTIGDREAAPFWGRAKLIREQVAMGNTFTIDELRKLPPQSFLQVEPYAWVWALTSYLDKHPDYGESFRKLILGLGKTGGIDAAFEKAFGQHKTQLNEQWRAYLADLDYGVNGLNSQIQYQPAKAERNNLRAIRADQSWQNSGVKVTAGKSYLIRSKGRYVIRQSQLNGKTVAWPCEPNGVTLDYYRKNPLGKLMVVVRPDDVLKPMDFRKTQAVGLAKSIIFSTTGTLYFRVNESPAGLHDNSGQFLVSVVQE